MDESRQLLTTKTVVCMEATKAAHLALQEAKKEFPKTGEIWIKSINQICSVDILVTQL